MIKSSFYFLTNLLYQYQTKKYTTKQVDKGTTTTTSKSTKKSNNNARRNGYTVNGCQ